MEILSYEELKSRCMAAMPEGIDTREGSLIDTAVGPVCAELASAYLTLQSYYDLLFPDTSAAPCSGRGTAVSSSPAGTT